ncbi:hypothetical protein [Psychroserpens damuponensis]|uniref:hypothetical protein n=1 Tax=Psychroserpens damuponensis TaxID=943936 RepID=UPI000590146C|nr:hypothetical protein [Psychroserpens damuponensis]
MRNVIQFDGIKFWIDQNVICCKLNTGFFKNHQWVDIDDIFYNAISILSKGRYLPILISFGEINNSNSLKTFNVLSNGKLMRTLDLPRVFLVHSSSLKMLLSLHHNIGHRISPTKIFKDFNRAIAYCNNEHLVYKNFNKQRLV